MQPGVHGWDIHALSHWVSAAGHTLRGIARLREAHPWPGTLAAARRHLIWHRTSAFVLRPAVTVAIPAAWHSPAPLL
jgi:hypothetical protein